MVLCNCKYLFILFKYYSHLFILLKAVNVTDIESPPKLKSFEGALQSVSEPLVSAHPPSPAPVLAGSTVSETAIGTSDAASLYTMLTTLASRLPYPMPVTPLLPAYAHIPPFPNPVTPTPTRHSYYSSTPSGYPQPPSSPVFVAFDDEDLRRFLREVSSPKFDALSLYFDTLSSKHIGPDVITRMDIQTICDLGFTLRDATYLKESASQWWKRESRALKWARTE